VWNACDACEWRRYAVLVELLGESGSQRAVLTEHKHVVRHEDAVGVLQQPFGLQVLHARRDIKAQLATVCHRHAERLVDQRSLRFVKQIGKRVHVLRSAGMHSVRHLLEGQNARKKVQG
jgi:hypothetical protein